VSGTQKSGAKGNKRGKERNYMKAFRYYIVSILAVMMFGTPLAFANPEELAKIDGIVITEKDFKDRVMILPERSIKVLDKDKFLDKLIDEELIIREAQKKNLHEIADYRNRVEAFKKELLVDLYLQQYLKENNTEENQKKYYEENKEKYTSPEMVRISLIKVETEDGAKDIVKKARAGEDFAELAKKYSKDPSVRKGGDFDYRARKGLRKEFGDVAFAMKVSEISDPIKISDGYYIIKLTDHKEGGIATFDQVKINVGSEYMNKLLKEKIEELRKAVKIQIDTARLKNLKID
jgi:peptidyl-prolyl cis-trans isomerase C